MTIHCQCSHCKTRMKLPAKLAGSKARCPKCKNVFLIPKEETQPTINNAAAVAQPPSGQPVDDETSRNPPPPAPENLPGSGPGSDAVIEPANTPPFIAPPQNVVNETTLPVAQAVPIDQPAGSVPMATPVVTPDSSPVAAPVVGVVAPKIRRRKSGAKGFLGFILGLLALMGCLAILGGVGYWLTTRGPQNGTVAIAIPVEHRKDCVLFVDGGDRAINRVGKIELLLAAGTHEIELRRLGFEPLKMQLLVTARKELPVTPRWTPVEPEPPSVPGEPDPDSSPATEAAEM